MPVEGMYSVQEIVEAIKNPGIIHYTGHHKPWTFLKFTHHPYAHRFWHFALMAPVGKLYKAKIILKRLFTGRFHDAAVKRDWDKSILKTDWD